MATYEKPKFMNEAQLKIIYKFIDLTNCHIGDWLRLEEEVKLRLSMLRQFKSDIEMLRDDLCKADNKS